MQYTQSMCDRIYCMNWFATSETHNTYVFGKRPQKLGAQDDDSGIPGCKHEWLRYWVTQTETTKYKNFVRRSKHSETYYTENFVETDI